MKRFNSLSVIWSLDQLSKFILDQYAICFKLMLVSWCFCKANGLFYAIYKFSLSVKIGFSQYFFIINFSSNFKLMIQLLDQQVLPLLETTTICWCRSISPRDQTAYWKSNDSASKQEYQKELSPKSTCSYGIRCMRKYGIDIYSFQLE